MRSMFAGLAGRGASADPREGVARCEGSIAGRAAHSGDGSYHDRECDAPNIVAGAPSSSSGYAG